MARNKLRVDVCLLFLERFRKAGIIAHVTVASEKNHVASGSF
jgi:hypothetical protein